MILLAVLILNFTFVYNIYASENKLSSIVIDTFSNYTNENNKLPYGWYATQDDVSMFFMEKENENWFIKIRTQGGNTTIGKECKYRVSEYPVLSWRWRMHKLPDGARESVRDSADSGAGVYVIFKGAFRLNRMLKYVWSSSLPKGSVTDSPYNKRTKIIVLRNNTDRLGEWLFEEVNVLEDYRRVFNEEPPKVECIAIMSDSDNTQSLVEADYDDIRVRALQ
ncbi:MAG: DUF3047 domain-containing protein [Fibrobacter sp.]|nr:DUF3047 domain-containing protein [Fibrobacter sp.]